MEIHTLIDLLEYRAEVSGDKTAYTFQGKSTTFKYLWDQVNQFASLLLEKKIKKQECVVIALPNSAEFFFAFYGAQRAGGIAVPLFPASSAERIASIAEACEARIVVLPDDSPKKSELEEKGLVVLECKSLLLQNELADDFPKVQRDDIAFLQYTSGST
ncbi:MAG: AMP-binding protein, partial [Anaerolineales bacterium]|nr:AMP-binding protein [Anaerolineales bacterium]